MAVEAVLAVMAEGVAAISSTVAMVAGGGGATGGGDDGGREGIRGGKG